MATGKGRRVARDGGVTSTRGLKERSHCKRNMFPIIVYAFTAPVCAMLDLGSNGSRPRWPCLPRQRWRRPPASPYDVELLRSTLVARPAVHRNHLVPPARHCGPNSAQTPPASHPASARPRSCCRYAGGSHSRRTALRSPAPPRVVLEEATSARDPRNVRRVHGESDLPQKSMSKTFRSGLGEAAACPPPDCLGRPKPYLGRCELSFQGTEIYQGRVYRGETLLGALDTQRGRPRRIDKGVRAPEPKSPFIPEIKGDRETTLN